VDAMREVADAYLVLSNDSDLAEPIRLVVHDLGATAGLILPSPRLLGDEKREFRTPEGW
jgi:hypothetical protein